MVPVTRWASLGLLSLALNALLAEATNCGTETRKATVYETTTCVVNVTETVIAHVTLTQTSTATVPSTITAYTTTTKTITSTTFDPCPSTCSISAGIVTLGYWPTDRPYTYPSVYYDPRLSYTFTSPSVYMIIPTAKGTNSVSGDIGPKTSNWILPLRLDEVSTIYSGSLTRQLTLSDLGTDCPQTADPTALATLDGRCNPILAAPTSVSTWAYPCNACGRFGLFDPPYAVPTLPGGLVPTTATPAPQETTPAPTVVPTTASASLPVVSLPTSSLPVVTTAGGSRVGLSGGVVGALVGAVAAVVALL